MPSLYGLHRVRLRPGVDPAEFERFALGEFIPALQALGVPGVRFALLKAERGVEAGAYQFLMAFDSVDVRDRYFPEESRASPELIALVQPLRALSEVWESLSERDKTDWLLLDPAQP